MSRYKKVKDYPDLIKDMQVGAVINVSEESYREYKRNKKRQEEILNKEKERDQKIENLEKNVEELKLGLKEILEAIKNVNS